MKRVLLCNENRGFGGGEVHTLGLARDLAQYGYQPALLCRRGSWLDTAGPDVVRLYAPFANEIDAFTVARAASLLRRFSVAHAHAGRDHLLVGVAARMTRVPMVRTLHSFLEPTLSGLARRILRRHTDRVVCVSEAMRAHAAEWGVPPQRLMVIPNGVDVDRFQPASREEARRALDLPIDRPLVGAVSGLWDLKGPDLLLEAFAHVPPDAMLVVAGDGPMRADLEARAARLGFAARARFLGKLDDPRPVYAASDVVVLASRQDAFPLVALEAQGCGRPIVAFRVGGIPEAVTDATGLLVPALDTAALGEAIAALVADPARHERMGRAAAEHVRARFSRRGMLTALAELYDALAAERALARR